MTFVLKHEPPPSLCRHHVPDDGLHELSNRCWCKPFLQNEPFYTIVNHNATTPGDA